MLLGGVGAEHVLGEDGGERRGRPGEAEERRRHRGADGRRSPA